MRRTPQRHVSPRHRCTVISAVSELRAAAIGTSDKRPADDSQSTTASCRQRVSATRPQIAGDVTCDIRIINMDGYT